MTRLVPHPILTGALVLMWLLLNQFSLGHLLLGTAVALVAGQAMAALEPNRPRIRRVGTAVRLVFVVLADVARSNLAVTGLVLGGRSRSPGFVEIDVALRDPMALAVLAVVVTATPGTAWIDYDASRGRVLLHVLDLKDADEWRATVNDRYARMLQEIFE